MDAWVTTLVLGSALLHAAWNALIKGGRDRLVTMCAITAVSCGLGLAGALALPPPAPASRPFLLASVLIHVAYRSFLLGAYRVGDLSHVYPVARGTGPLLVALVGAPLAGEVLGPLEWAACWRSRRASSRSPGAAASACAATAPRWPGRWARA